MKSNIIPMQNGVIKSGEFSFTRRAAKLKAYGEEFELPAKTVEFADKLDAVRAEMLTTPRTSDTARSLKKGIALFIGEEKTEKLFPDDKIGELDSDEILGFWSALNYELNRHQREIINKYSR